MGIQVPEVRQTRRTGDNLKALYLMVRSLMVRFLMVQCLAVRCLMVRCQMVQYPMARNLMARYPTVHRCLEIQVLEVDHCR